MCGRKQQHAPGFIDPWCRHALIDGTSPKYEENISKLPLLKICTYAKALYKLFSEAWNCNCKSKHRFRLLLKHRESEKADFCMYLLFEETQPQPTNHWGHGQAMFEIIEKMPSTVKKKVSFVDTPKVGHPSGAPIKEFCGFISKASKSPKLSSYVSFLDDENHSYSVKLVNPPDQKTLREGHTLAAALSIALTQERNHLSLADRWAIALVLASSVLQLYSTPWVKRNWGKKDICFFRNGPLAISHRSSYTWEEPWLSFDWRTEMKAGSHNDTLDPQAPEKRLAIVLLELGFGKPIENSTPYVDWMKKLPPSCNKSIIESLAATEWQRYVMKDSCQYYADAIKWCLDNPAENTSKNGEKWMQHFYENVILPLEKCTKFSTADFKPAESQMVVNNGVWTVRGGVYFGYGRLDGSQAVGIEDTFPKYQMIFANCK